MKLNKDGVIAATTITAAAVGGTAAVAGSIYLIGPWTFAWFIPAVWVLMVVLCSR